MGDSTKISWTDATWNPIRGCSRVSEGCRNCYAETLAGRFCGPGQPYEGLAVRRLKVISDDEQRMEARWTGEVRFVAEHLADPLRWRKPRRIFVNSMSDLFHESLTNEQIAAVFGVMAASPKHTFQILTKRARRMREWFEWMHRDPQWAALRCQEAAIQHGAWIALLDPTGYAKLGWPLPNVWLGVSVENQAAADERIPELLQTPAALRFLSCEPLLGPVDIQPWTQRASRCTEDDPCAACLRDDGVLCRMSGNLPRIDWAIAGCESGAGARPCNVEWQRSLRDQCAAAEVPFFLKQAKLGSGCPPRHSHNDTEGCETCTCTWSAGDTRVGSIESGVTFGPGSKRKPGGIIELPYLDGVQHAAFPEVKP
jgi:protein gp37